MREFYEWLENISTLTSLYVSRVLFLLYCDIVFLHFCWVWKFVFTFSHIPAAKSRSKPEILLGRTKPSKTNMNIEYSSKRISDTLVPLMKTLWENARERERAYDILGEISSQEIMLAKSLRHNFWWNELVLTYFVIAFARRKRDWIYIGRKGRKRRGRKRKIEDMWYTYVYVSKKNCYFFWTRVCKIRILLKCYFSR